MSLTDVEITVTFWNSASAFSFWPHLRIGMREQATRSIKIVIWLVRNRPFEIGHCGREIA